MRNPMQYREHRAAVRRLHVAVIETVEGQHRALVHGDLAKARLFTDDLAALCVSLETHMRWLVSYVDSAATYDASERSAQ